MSYITYKIKREALRIADQINGWKMRLYEPFVRYRHYKHFYNNIQLVSGSINQYVDNKGTKIALLLIYQPNKIAESVYLTCEHLIYNGYNPLIVSNTSISDNDIEKLKIKAWRILIRPNFGYDFGGYKDGIKYLQDEKIDIDKLIVMNDSIWFPLYENDTSINKMELSNTDFCGLLEHQKPLKFNNFLSFKKSVPFLESYFWLFKNTAYNNDAFKTYWNNYKPTSNKYHTIRQGERKITLFLHKKKLTYISLLSDSSVSSWLSKLNNHQLLSALQKITSPDIRLSMNLQYIIAQFSDNLTWRLLATDVALKTINGQSILITSPTIASNELGIGMLKKGSNASGVHAINFFIDRVNQDDSVKKPHPIIWAEMLERSKKKY